MVLCFSNVRFWFAFQNGGGLKVKQYFPFGHTHVMSGVIKLRPVKTNQTGDTKIIKFVKKNLFLIRLSKIFKPNKTKAYFLGGKI